MPLHSFTMKLHCSNCSFYIPTLILLQRTMDPDLQAELLSCYNASLEWTQSFKIRQNNADIDLSWACGPNSSSIPSAVDQPKHFPDRSYFRFPKCYHGEASLESLTEMIKGVLPGANFVNVRDPASIDSTVCILSGTLQNHRHTIMIHTVRLM